MTLGDIADRHGDGIPAVVNGCPTDQAVGRLHGDRANHVVADVLGYFESKGLRATTLVTLIEGDVDGECVIQLGHRLDGELHVDHGAGYSGNAPDAGCGLSCLCHCRSSSFCVSLLRWGYVLCREGVGAADDLADFLGDLGLAGLVGLAGQGSDEFLRVVGCGLHRSTARSVL